MKVKVSSKNKEKRKRSKVSKTKRKSLVFSHKIKQKSTPKIENETLIIIKSKELKKVTIPVVSFSHTAHIIPIKKKVSYFHKLLIIFSKIRMPVLKFKKVLLLSSTFIPKNSFKNLKKRILIKRKKYLKKCFSFYAYYEKLVIKYFKKQKRKILRKFNRIFPTPSWRRVATAAFLILLLILSTFNNQMASAATYTFAQTSWAGGASELTGLHPGDQTGWNKYESKDANLAIVNDGAGLQLSTAASSLTQTNDGTTTTGFNLSGTDLSGTVVSGTGASAGVKLDSTSFVVDAQNTYSVGTYPDAIVFDSSTNSMWVANYNSNNVTKMNSETGATIGTYNVGTNPKGITFDSSTNSVWVSNFGSNNVTKLSVADGSLIGTYNVGTSPAGIVFDPHTNSIWTANYGSNNVTKLSAADGSLIGTYAVGANPAAIVFDSSTNSVWIGNIGDTSTSKLNTTDGSTVGTYAVGGGLWGADAFSMVFDPYTNSVWALGNQWLLAKINAADGSVIKSFEIANYSTGLAFDSYTNSVWVIHSNNRATKIDPTSATGIATINITTGGAQVMIAFDPHTNSMWSTNNSSNTVTKSSVLVGQISGSYNIGVSPYQIIFENYTNSIWTANVNSANITKVNPSTGTVIGTYSVGTTPYGLAFDPITNSIWTANYGSNNVTKRSAADGSLIGTYALGRAPYMITFDSYTNSMWTANANTASVTKMNVLTGEIIGTYDVGSNAQGITFDSYTNSVWVITNSGLIKINPSTGEILGSYTSGTNGIIFDPYTNSIWTTRYNSGFLTKTDVSTGAQASYASGVGYPGPMVFDPFSNSIWSLESYYGSGLGEINASTGVLVKGQYFSENNVSFAFDSSTNSIWAATGTNLKKILVANVTYDSSGTYTSGVIDLGSKAESFSTATYNKTTPTNTSVVVDVRAGDNATVDGTWTSWITGIASGADISSLGSHQYVQYKATLATSDTTISPTLDDLTFNYNLYATDQTLTSSAYDSTDDGNVIGAVGWNEDATLPTGTTVTFSLRTAPTKVGLATADWYNFTNATTHCTKADTTVSCPATAIPSALKTGGDDEWWQYKLTLSSNGALTPTVSGAEVKYVVNAPPELQNVTATQGSDGLVNISYEVKDTDTLTGTNTPGKVTPSFEYWNGSAWVVCATLSAGATENKDVSSEFATYTLTWNPKTDFNSHYSTGAKIRVKVNDNEAANNLATLESATFTLDTTDPVVNTFVLDARSDATNNITIDVTEDTITGLKMKLSNNSDLSVDPLNSDSGAWIDYASTKSWIFATSSPTVYYQLKDSYGNISNNGVTQSVILPARPLNIVYQDVSSLETSEWREFIAWGEVAEPSLGFKQYNIYRSDDGTNFSLLGDPQTDKSTNFILDTDLDTETTYYYRVTVEDDANNTSAYSDVISDRPDGQGGTDLTPPIISNIVVSDITAQSALVTWETDEPSSSSVAYITNDSGDFTGAPTVGVTSMVDNAARLGKHSVFLNNLSSGVRYYIQVSSSDPNTNTSTGGTGTFFDVLSGPVISNVASSNVQNTSAAISWNTTEQSDSHVYYSTDSAFATYSTADMGDSVTSHSVNLTELQAGRTYYYYVKSGIAEDKNIIEGEAAYYSFTTSSDLAAPVITFDSGTGITEKTETSVRISWTTNELATSSIEYGVGGVYDTSATNDNLNTNHSHQLTGLTKGTAYNFRLRNTDTNGNPALLDSQTFTTLDLSDTDPPVITEVQAEQVFDTSALITWTTDEPANSLVNYGIAPATYTGSSTNTSYDYSHSVILTGLTVNTPYYYKVTSVDSNGNSTVSEEEGYIFTTSKKLTTGGGGTNTITTGDTSTDAPIISGVLVKNITASQATVEWQTNKGADSLVEFGTTTSYGLASASRASVSTHSQILLNLLPATPYNYKITSIDTSGNLSSPYTGTFNTLSITDDSTIDTTLPTNPEDQAKNDAKFSDVLRNAFNFLKQASKTVSLAVLESSLEEQQNNIQELSSLTPTPNIVSGPDIKTWEDMASISWTTDKKTNSLIAYSEEGTPLTDTDKTQIIGNPGIYSLDHQVIISSLKPETTYNYQLRGSTSIGSKIVFEPDTFTTLAKSAKVDNYVADRLTDDTASFKWSSSLPTNTSVRITPYRNNTLSYDEARVLNDPLQTSIHQMTVDNLEPGVFYKIDLFGSDASGRTLSQSIEAFSTSSKELPFLIEQVKTSSALAAGESLKVQSIISWSTTKLSTSKVYYRKGTSKDDNNWPLESSLDSGYTRRHLVVMTDFDPGEVYQFQVESADSNGDKIRSKTYTILTPKQKESVFQVIFKNVEQTFGWMGGNEN